MAAHFGRVMRPVLTRFWVPFCPFRRTKPVRMRRMGLAGMLAVAGLLVMGTVILKSAVGLRGEVGKC